MQHPSETTFTIQGPAGKLELATTSGRQNSPVAIICHPHPLYGGTMQNKVVTTLEKTFRELDFSTVRFNFRGIGKSTGVYDQGVGEVKDLLAVVAWVKELLPQRKIYLAGFSFGGCVAIKAATEILPERLVVVAPGVEHFDVSTLQVPCPWILVQGEQDEVVPPALVYAWMEKQRIQPTLIKIVEATHFFHGKLIEMRERLLEAIRAMDREG